MLLNEIEPKVLTCRPDWGDTACKWGSAQMERKTLRYFIESEFDVVDLHASQATKVQIFAYWGTCTYAEVLGHGNPTTFTAQRQEVVFKVGDKDTEDLAKESKTIGVNFISCSVGQTLVPRMIDLGLRCAIASDDDIVFLIDERQFPNGKAEPFWDSLCASSLKVSEKTTLYEGYLYEMTRWEYWIGKADTRTKPYLVHDYNHRNFYGDKKFNPSNPQDEQPEPPPEPKAYKFKISGNRTNSCWDSVINGYVEEEGTITLEVISET